MKNPLLIAFISFFLFSCSKDRITASGDKITETRTPGRFTGVFGSGASNIYITYGEEYKVVLKGSDNLIPYFESQIVGDHLYLGYKRVSIQRDDIEVYVTLPEISRVALSGSGKLDISGDFPAISKFRLTISGSGDAIVQDEIEAGEVSVDISGSGKASLEKMLSQTADVDISGSGDARIAVQDYLKARISGSGKVYYNGNPTIDSRISGSGKVIKF